MAYKKKFKRGNYSKKKRGRLFSSEEKWKYHKSRQYSASKYGIKFGDAKYCYSSGFTDAFTGHDNSRAITAEFGKKRGEAYSAGYDRGSKARKEYFTRTGLQPSNIGRDIDYKG